MLRPPRANGRERFFELRGGDLLPAPTRQEHEPPRPVETESLEAPEPAPPCEVAGPRVGCAVLFDTELDRRAFDEHSQNFAGDFWVNSVAVSFFFPLDPGGEILRSQAGTVSPIPNLQQATRYSVMDLGGGGDHQAALRCSARTSARRCFAAHTTAA